MKNTWKTLLTIVMVIAVYFGIIAFTVSLPNVYWRGLITVLVSVATGLVSWHFIKKSF